MASEGYDNPDLDTLILASPKCNVEQAIGRILRKKNKNEAIVVDINDCISIFNNWNIKRKSFYKSKKFKIINQGFEVNEVNEVNEVLVNEVLVNEVNEVLVNEVLVNEVLVNECLIKD